MKRKQETPEDEDMQTVLKRFKPAPLPLLTERVCLAKNPRESWYIYEHLPRTLQLTSGEFLELWGMRPTNYPMESVYGKYIHVPRLVRVYGLAPYTDKQGVIYPAVESLPNTLRRYLDYANSLQVLQDFAASVYEENTEVNVCFNNLEVVWYPDGEHYYEARCFNEPQIYKDPHKDTLVVSFWFGQAREFQFLPLVNPQNKAQKPDPSLQKAAFQIEDNSLVVMGGAMQATHRHTVPQLRKEKGRTQGICINVRSFLPSASPKAAKLEAALPEPRSQAELLRTDKQKPKQLYVYSQRKDSINTLA